MPGAREAGPPVAASATSPYCSTADTGSVDSECQTDRVDVFECNICLDAANEPVVTLCGHLYCWPCIYRWIEVSAAPACPVCKAPVSQKRLIPVYGRGKPQLDPRTAQVEVVEKDFHPIPSRPHSRRPGAHRRTSSYASETMQATASAEQVLGLSGTTWAPVHPGLGVTPLGPTLGGLFPLGLHLISHVVPPSAFALQHGEALVRSPEQAQQAFLSRLLLLLGSFVILCLLLF
mmetsp:Transcript_6263/g.18657  ORF Transcript_6263/g.18657 Transcript_6263/m.18657 type:complete len:233 (+) Transcript_6263:52-750(+)